jgi:tryptophan 2-C-methyltransferase
LDLAVNVRSAAASARPFLLVNTNTLRPPVSAVGLEYAGEALVASGFPVAVVDLAFEPEWKTALARELREEPLAVALTVRNTDDCCFATRTSFLPWIREVVGEVRRLTAAPVVLGGVGFSVMPEAVLRMTGADLGIAGDGEQALPDLAECLSTGDDISRLPGLVYRRDGQIVANGRRNVDLKGLPLPRRRLFDNARYERSGAMVGIETKRGCARRCTFCADPVAKGRRVRVRPPEILVQELRGLLAQGVSWFHIADSEFNQPLDHAKAVCRAIVEAGLGARVRWYCYCSPTPFDDELAALMERSGCAGINFGVDALCDAQLARLGRSHRLSDVKRLAALLNARHTNYIFDLLVGGPGETEETAAATVDAVRRLNVPLIGISAGLRVYPGTQLGRAAADRPLEGLQEPEAGSLAAPRFYLSPAIADVFGLLKTLVAGDSRFFVLSAPAEDGSYNYAGDDQLASRIAAGARGAYWDILRSPETKPGPRC